MLSYVDSVVIPVLQIQLPMPTNMHTLQRSAIPIHTSQLNKYKWEIPQAFLTASISRLTSVTKCGSQYYIQTTTKRISTPQLTTVYKRGSPALDQRKLNEIKHQLKRQKIYLSNSSKEKARKLVTNMVLNNWKNELQITPIRVSLHRMIYTNL